MPDVGDLIAEKYRLVRVIGRGGMGSVYEAEHTQLGKRVAIKVLHPDMAKERRFRARFMREARAAARTGHRAVVEVHDIGTDDDGSTFIVMELLEGRSLAEALKDKLTLPAGVAAHVACEVLSALHSVHESGILHRDIKPQNVFLLDGPEDLPVVKVLDFGVAKVEGGESKDLKLTRTGASVGTPAYMAPEQALGRRDLDRRVDVWSVGVMLYLTVTGRKPYLPNEVLIAMRVPDAPTPHPPPPTTIQAGLPIELEKVILRALTIDRDKRYPTAEAMRQALLPYVAADSGTEQPHPAGLQRVDSNLVTAVWPGGRRPEDAYASTDGAEAEAEPAAARPVPADTVSTAVGPYGVEEQPAEDSEVEPPTIRRPPSAPARAAREEEIAKLPPIEGEEAADMAVAPTVKSPVIVRKAEEDDEARPSGPPTVRAMPRALRAGAGGAGADPDANAEDTAHESVPFGLRSEQSDSEPPAGEERGGLPDVTDERPTVPWDSSAPPPGLAADEPSRQQGAHATAETGEPVPRTVVEPSGEIPGQSPAQAIAPEWSRAAEAPETAPEVEEARSGGRSWLLPAAAAVIVLAGLGALAAALWLRQEPPPPAAPVGFEPPSLARSVVLTVKATPASASIRVDGRPVPGSLFRGELPRDESVHEVVVEAAGYTTYSEQFLLLEDRELDIRLERIGEAGSGDGGAQGQPDGSDGGASRAESSVRFDSQPQGARVLREGHLLCTTPCQSSLPTGVSLQIRFVKQGFQEVEIAVEPGRDQRILAELPAN